MAHNDNCLVKSPSAHAGLLPDRVERAAQERVAAGTYPGHAFNDVSTLAKSGPACTSFLAPESSVSFGNASDLRPGLGVRARIVFR